MAVVYFIYLKKNPNSLYFLFTPAYTINFEHQIQLFSPWRVLILLCLNFVEIIPFKIDLIPEGLIHTDIMNLLCSMYCRIMQQTVDICL